MNTVSFCTLGCKVNQYDTEAMRELFKQAGYQELCFDDVCDVYVINTCTVTGTGDQKSYQAMRRALRLNPSAVVVMTGCMAQKEGVSLLSQGARVVLGTQQRGRVVELVEEALVRGVSLCAVGALEDAPFERLNVAHHEGHTRAVMKIQEGCDNRCSYCIIPSVRGHVRSRPMDDIRQEARALRDNGYREIVVTGIHLVSYGRDVRPLTLMDALRAISEEAPGLRIRLGSLEPNVASDEFVDAMTRIPGLCPQFHLALQSGSDDILRRMRRQYNAAQFVAAAARLRAAFPHCALTTDVMAGFPGEGETEHAQSMNVCRQVQFSRMHVFPFSPREGTPAAEMQDQVPDDIKERRARELRQLGTQMAGQYCRSLVGLTLPVLFEEPSGDGAQGYIPQYIRVFAAGAQPGQVCPVRLTAVHGDGLCGELVTEA